MWRRNLGLSLWLDTNQWGVFMKWIWIWSVKYQKGKKESNGCNSKKGFKVQAMNEWIERSFHFHSLTPSYTGSHTTFTHRFILWKIIKGCDRSTHNSERKEWINTILSFKCLTLMSCSRLHVLQPYFMEEVIQFDNGRCNEYHTTTIKQSLQLIISSSFRSFSPPFQILHCLSIIYRNVDKCYIA